MMVVEAAIAAWQGDLEPASKWLTIMGRQVIVQDEELRWEADADKNLPGGGFPAGVDPIAGIVLIMIGTCGELWTHHPMLDEIFKAVKAEWSRLGTSERKRKNA